MYSVGVYSTGFSFCHLDTMNLPCGAGGDRDRTYIVILNGRKRHRNYGVINVPTGSEDRRSRCSLSIGNGTSVSIGTSNYSRWHPRYSRACSHPTTLEWLVGPRGTEERFLGHSLHSSWLKP